ncbi:hypothetical protein GPJ56_000571 [Histomonas meleagridis]|uniref:uncharacterized protein n=1 Tax=Histomonas meleagridis TaxID=135588 RepID=UPI00355A9FFF|nr:hypothetical protein GPJ56_000571 [Histomonas meleagridis]KAH0796389.1 hypothetical protein GO595_010282 [Histomonas meleagridis]
MKNSMINYFGYQTKSFDLPLVLQPKTFVLKSFTQYSLEFELPLPFIQNYTGTLFCVDPNHFKGSNFHVPKSLLAQTENYVPLNLQINKFSNSFNWSQMQCFGNTLETRFCDMRHVALHKGLLVFSTPADFIFPEPFISSSARSFPNDRPESRLQHEPVVIHNTLMQLNSSSIFYPQISYLISRFWNTLMLWHMIYDFLLPVFQTIERIEGDTTNRERNIFIKDIEPFVHKDFYKAISKYPIKNVLHDSDTRIFNRLIVGLEKTEISTNGNSVQRMLGAQFKFRNSSQMELQSEVFKELQIPKHKLDVDNPLILIIERKTKSRKFVNVDAIEDYILSKCDFCSVKRIDFAKLKIKEQIEMAANASVVVGVHGSGLSHVIWMKRSTKDNPTSLVELFPHGYVCRNWFETAANVAGVDYYKVFAKRNALPVNATEQYKWQMNYCWDHGELCTMALCHDVLRDQNVTVEIGAFSGAWLPIVNKLKSAQKMKS